MENITEISSLNILVRERSYDTGYTRRRYIKWIFLVIWVIAASVTTNFFSFSQNRYSYKKKIKKQITVLDKFCLLQIHVAFFKNIPIFLLSNKSRSQIRLSTTTLVKQHRVVFYCCCFFFQRYFRFCDECPSYSIFFQLFCYSFFISSSNVSFVSSVYDIFIRLSFCSKMCN